MRSLNLKDRTNKPITKYLSRPKNISNNKTSNKKKVTNPTIRNNSVLIVQANKIESLFEECCICYLLMDQRLKCQNIQLDCHHKYHKACIYGWIKDHKQCPMCRKTVTEGIVKKAKLLRFKKKL